MSKITVPDLLDAYDYLRDKCRKVGPWTESVGIKEWLERSVIIGGLFVYRPKRRIQAIMMGWPTNQIVDGEDPQYVSDGEIFFVKFSHGAMSKDMMDRALAAAAMERHPFVTKFCFMEYSEKGESEPRLLELDEEAVHAQ